MELIPKHLCNAHLMYVRHACTNALDDPTRPSGAPGMAEDIMRITIEQFKIATVEIAPYMEDANVTTILKSIKDMSCMALMPQTSDCEETLEAMMPESDLPHPSNVLA